MERLIEIGLSNAVMAAVLAVLAALASLACRRPALVHALWLLVLVKLVTPPLAPVHFHLSRPEESREVALLEEQPAEEEPVTEERPAREEVADVAVPVEPAAEEDRPAAEEPARAAAEPMAEPGTRIGWVEWLGRLWLAGACLWFSLAIRRVWCFARMLRHGRPAPVALQDRVARLARRIGLSRCPKVLLLPGRLAPLVWGLGRPRLLVPEGLPGRLGERELDTLLLHELAHIRRRDHLVRWLEFVALGLFWWNPVVWYARRELRDAEELCCDAWVVGTLAGAGRAYATALLDVVDFLCAAPTELPPLASGLGKIADLKRRLTMIMRGATPPALGWSWGLTVSGLALLLLPIVPGLGQTQEPPDGRKTLIRFVEKSEVADANLKQIQAEIEKKAAELAALKVKMEQLKLAARAKALQAELKGKDVEAVRVRVAPPGGATIRIEISGLNVNADELKKLADALEKSLPGKQRRVLILNPGKDVVYRAVTGPVRAVEVVPMPPPVARGMFAPGPGAKHDSVEKKLDTLLRELEALRKEIRGGRDGNDYQPRKK